MFTIQSSCSAPFCSTKYFIKEVFFVDKLCNLPIGIFDSGLGGLTVVKKIINLLPNENIIYFGDTARMPYGSKSRDVVMNYAIQSINFLLSKKNKVIVAACGTVSTVLCDLPRYKHIIGVVEPSCIAASKVTKNNNVGVIATPSAIESKKYQENIKKIDPNIKVISKSCPLLAPLIESRFVNKNDQILKDVLKFYIEPMLEENIDTLILGCTHYPIVKDTISEIAKNITIVDSGSETANFLFNYLRLKKLNNNERKQKLKIFVSDLSQNFVDNANFFLGKDVSKDVIKTKI